MKKELVKRFFSSETIYKRKTARIKVGFNGSVKFLTPTESQSAALFGYIRNGIYEKTLSEKNRKEFYFVLFTFN